jgi:hypothetical protein
MPNTRVRRASGTVSGNIACSSEVNGPDSTTSVDSVPVSATIISTTTFVVTANAIPLAAKPRNSNK